jgi:transposase-like protein
MGRGSQFTVEFKQEAVCKAETSQNVSRTARELGISNQTLHQCQPRKVERFAVIEQARDDIAVGELCRALDVSESGYYAWRETKPSVHDQRDAYLSEQIQTVFDESRHTYGSNRVEAALRAQGICTSRKRVARIMRHLHLRSVRVKPHRPCLTRSVQDQIFIVTCCSR